MSSKVLAVAISCIALGLFSVSCMKHAQPPSAAAGSFPPQMDISVCLEMAVKEIRKAHDLNEPYELSAKVSATGDWVFTFSFLPKTPGAEIIAVVGTNGLQVMPGI